MPSKDIIDVEPVNRQAADSLKTWGWVSYILHLIVAVGAVVPGAQVSVALLLVALAIDLVKRDDALGTWQQSHFSWRIRSVLWAAIWYALTFWGFLLGLLLFNPIWVVVSVWFLYRIVRGMVAMERGVAVGA
ncbi:hypothetical protein CCO03_05170 [Comamonas serinivorans]|uniref:Transmembrane protein n=1 Tax=Comamonas serinivorans TaxID=1082851 RepID=A0A1Y0EKP8_9BURK|nr:hypothetical protein [Comamonas serinivorans]ARU04146.1 hypothetical protein CCO03_05170 [Comamonas serinivorans]